MYPGLDAKKEMEAEAAAGGEDAMKPSWNPFLFPFKLLTTLFIQPLRSKIVSQHVAAAVWLATPATWDCKAWAAPRTPEERLSR